MYLYAEPGEDHRCVYLDHLKEIEGNFSNLKFRKIKINL